MKRLRATDLFDKVALEGDVSAGFVRNWYGDNAGESLCLMNDGVSVGQVLPVIYSDLAASNHPAQLILDLVWRHKLRMFFACFFMFTPKTCMYSMSIWEAYIFLCPALCQIFQAINWWKHKCTPMRKDSQASSLSLPCICGYLAISSKPHLSVVAVVSVPAANRLITVNIKFFSW